MFCYSIDAEDGERQTEEASRDHQLCKTFLLSLLSSTEERNRIERTDSKRVAWLLISKQQIFQKTISQPKKNEKNVEKFVNLRGKANQGIKK